MSHTINSSKQLNAYMPKYFCNLHGTQAYLRPCNNDISFSNCLENAGKHADLFVEYHDADQVKGSYPTDA